LAFSDSDDAKEILGYSFLGSTWIEMLVLAFVLTFN